MDAQEAMEKLEQTMGTKRLLIDDWNRLGWEFTTLLDCCTSICTLTNYTESKAEGGTLSFYLEQPADYKDAFLVHIFMTEGSGPHGVPWWDSCIYDKQMLTANGLEGFAKKLIDNCMQELTSSYWRLSWINGRNLPDGMHLWHFRKHDQEADGIDVTYIPGTAPVVPE